MSIRKGVITHIHTCIHTTDFIGIKVIIRELYAEKFSNLDEIDQFPESHKVPKVTQGEIVNLNNLKYIKETEH